MMDTLGLTQFIRKAERDITVTVLCSRLELPLISLYFARKM